MKSMFEELLVRFDSGALASTSVIPWSCPVPSFGDVGRARLATLGLNPSNREFVDQSGNELDGPARRFHTLRSLGIERWSDATSEQLEMMAESCRQYFARNPYDGWFGRLDQIIAGAGVSFYDTAAGAAHLDLVPYATARKWTDLRRDERCSLVLGAGELLGSMLRDSAIQVLVLNGQSVVDRFEAAASLRLAKKLMPAWALPRKAGENVGGYSYRGVVTEVGGIQLGRRVSVLGYNHNIQSSFGVTSIVIRSIASWIGRLSRESLK